MWCDGSMAVQYGMNGLWIRRDHRQIKRMARSCTDGWFSGSLRRGNPFAVLLLCLTRTRCTGAGHWNAQGVARSRRCAPTFCVTAVVARWMEARSKSRSVYARRHWISLQLLATQVEINFCILVPVTATGPVISNSYT